MCVKEIQKTQLNNINFSTCRVWKSEMLTKRCLQKWNKILSSSIYVILSPMIYCLSSHHDVARMSDSTLFLLLLLLLLPSSSSPPPPPPLFLPQQHMPCITAMAILFLPWRFVNAWPFLNIAHTSATYWNYQFQTPTTLEYSELILVIISFVILFMYTILCNSDCWNTAHSETNLKENTFVNERNLYIPNWQKKHME